MISYADRLPDLQPIGCYNGDKNQGALPVIYANFSGQINWTQVETVQQCAQVAFNRGFEYFAVQDYGECYTGDDAWERNTKYDKSDDCVETDKKSGYKVGKENTYFVYRIH